MAGESNQEYVFDPQQYYDASCNPDPDTDTCTKYVYDNGGRLKEVTTACNSSDASTVEYTYFDNGGRKEMKYDNQYGSNNTVSYTYYPSGQLYQATYPGFDGDPDVTTYEYNLNGALASKTDGSDRETAYLYDAAGRLCYVDEDDDETYEKEYVYNDRSQIEEIKNLGTIKIDYTYDDYGRLTRVTDATVLTANETQIDYTYYKSGLRETMETPKYKLTYEYDEAMRLEKLYRDISGDKLLAEYTYNALGQRTGYTRFDTNGTTEILHTEYQYLSDVGWLTYLENRKQSGSSGSNVISSFQYYKTTAGDGHDCVGNRKYMEFDNGANVAYTYDDRYQLETEARYTSTAQTTGVYRYTWSYDDAGNRLTQLKEEWDSGWADENYWEYTYNAANQLTDEDRWDDDSYTTLEAETTYAYDDAGNMTDKTFDDKTVADDDVDWDYTYNYENRQTKVEKDTGEGMAEVGEYIYNVLGNRVSREVNQTTTYEMYYDGVDCVGDDDGATERYFITPGLDENLMINNGSDYFYTQDGLGSVRELINTNKATQNTYEYEAFGSFYGTPTENVTNNWFTYTGREWDSESQTYYYRARVYDSTNGRFTSRDPLFWLTFYMYVSNGAPNATDPLGLLEAEDISEFKAILDVPEQKFVNMDWGAAFTAASIKYAYNVKWGLNFLVIFNKDIDPDCYGFYQEFQVEYCKVIVDQANREMDKSSLWEGAKKGRWYTDFGVKGNRKTTNLRTGEYKAAAKTKLLAITNDFPEFNFFTQMNPQFRWEARVNFKMYLVEKLPGANGRLTNKVAVIEWAITFREETAGLPVAGIEKKKYKAVQGRVNLRPTPVAKEEGIPKRTVFEAVRQPAIPSRERIREIIGKK